MDLKYSLVVFTLLLFGGIFKSEIYNKVKFPKSQISEITGQVDWENGSEKTTSLH